MLSIPSTISMTVSTPRDTHASGSAIHATIEPSISSWLPLLAGRAKAPRAPRGLCQGLDLDPVSPDNRGEHDLGNAIAPLDAERLLAEVDERHLQLPPI